MNCLFSSSNRKNTFETNKEYINKISVGIFWFICVAGLGLWHLSKWLEKIIILRTCKPESRFVYFLFCYFLFMYKLKKRENMYQRKHISYAYYSLKLHIRQINKKYFYMFLFSAELYRLRQLFLRSIWGENFEIIFIKNWEKSCLFFVYAKEYGTLMCCVHEHNKISKKKVFFLFWEIKGISLIK